MIYIYIIRNPQTPILIIKAPNIELYYRPFIEPCKVPFKGTPVLIIKAPALHEGASSFTERRLDEAGSGGLIMLGFMGQKQGLGFRGLGCRV